MPLTERITKIKQLQDLRKSFVITYVTGDRPNAPAIISEDVVRLFYEQLLRIDTMPEKPSKIDLFLYSRGGDTGVPWRLVPTIREFTKSFDCLVPFKAHSAATLIALGADNVVMGRKGELGPIDPSITTPFNPLDPADATKTRKFPVSVEDVSAYIGLLEDKFKLKSKSTEMAASFGYLAKEVNPLALGAVNRFHSLIRQLGTKLLKQRTKKGTDAEIKEIVDYLTEKLYYHGHAINRKEATEDLGLHVENATREVESAMWDLFLAYEKDMKLQEPFYPESFFENNPHDKHIEAGLHITAIETANLSLNQYADAQITRKRAIPQNLQLNLNLQLPQIAPQQQEQQALYQQILQQLTPQIQQQVQDVLRQQSPVVGFELIFKNQQWKRETPPH